jgi:hypothetical protein
VLRVAGDARAHSASPATVRKYLRLAMQGRPRNCFYVFLMRRTMIEAALSRRAPQTSVYRAVVKRRQADAAAVISRNHPPGVAELKNSRPTSLAGARFRGCEGPTTSSWRQGVPSFTRRA